MSADTKEQRRADDPIRELLAHLRQAQAGLREALFATVETGEHFVDPDRMRVFTGELAGWIERCETFLELAARIRDGRIKTAAERSRELMDRAVWESLKRRPPGWPPR